jgi:hypothetical protein
MSWGVAAGINTSTAIRQSGNQAHSGKHAKTENVMGAAAGINTITTIKKPTVASYSGKLIANSCNTYLK